VLVPRCRAVADPGRRRQAIVTRTPTIGRLPPPSHPPLQVMYLGAFGPARAVSGTAR